MVRTAFRPGGPLIGQCEVHIDGALAYVARCWLDFDAGEFGVEDPKDRTRGVEEGRMAFRNLLFPTQTGPLTANTLPVSFAVYCPHGGGMHIADSAHARLFDFLQLAPVWRFICNEPLKFYSAQTATEIFLRPGKALYLELDLSCGGELRGGAFGLCVVGSPDFGDAHHVALELAMGCPLREVSRQVGDRLTVRLGEWKAVGKFRPLYDPAPDGFRSHTGDVAGICEIYRAALTFQQKQPDGGRTFRQALTAYLECRSLLDGYVLKFLGTMQMLEWLDGRRTLDKQGLAQFLGTSEALAEAIVHLRNDIFHNNHDQRRGSDLAACVETAITGFQCAGVDLAEHGNGSAEAGLMNYLVSLVGQLLLKHIGADVSPVRYVPGYGQFQR